MVPYGVPCRALHLTASDVTALFTLSFNFPFPPPLSLSLSAFSHDSLREGISVVNSSRLVLLVSALEPAGTVDKNISLVFIFVSFPFGQ
jgi:hypothetical protein